MVKADYVSLWSAKQEFYQPRLLSSLLTPTGRGGSVVIRDYVRALKWLTALESAMHSLGHPITKGTCSQVGSLQDLCSMLHPSDKFRLGMDMCLCGTLSSLPDDRQTEILESSSWLATEKIRGVRALLLSYAAPGRGSRFSLYSRFLSDDCGLIDWGPKLWQQHNFGQGVTAVDVEICYPHSMDDFKTLFEGAENLASTSTGVVEYVLSLPENQALGIQSQFYAKYQRHMFSLMVICPIFYEKVNYLKQPLRAGWDVYTQVVSHLRSAGLNAFEVNRCFGGKFEKVSFLDSILNRGGEVLCFITEMPSTTLQGPVILMSWLRLRTVSAALLSGLWTIRSTLSLRAVRAPRLLFSALSLASSVRMRMVISIVRFWASCLLVVIFHCRLRFWIVVFHD